MMDGKTRLVGVMGWPIGHSLSPAMQNAAFRALKLNFIYLPLAVRPQDIEAAVRGALALNFDGFNVTIPHKVNVIPCLDRLDESAQAMGAVNTVVIRQGETVGYNTDSEGFIQALHAHGVDVAGTRVALLGAGGAARAVLFGLLRNGAKTVAVGARHVAEAQKLVQAFARDNQSAQAFFWQDTAFNAALQECDIFVNCTPIGMSPHDDGMLPFDPTIFPRHAVLCDLVYNPRLTTFLSIAGRQGYRTVPGADMLVYQGARAFELWTGQPAPIELMQKTLTTIL